MTTEQAHTITLEAMLKRGDAWKCQNCGEITGNLSQQCSGCFSWKEDQVIPQTTEQEKLDADTCSTQPKSYD